MKPLRYILMALAATISALLLAIAVGFTPWFQAHQDPPLESFRYATELRANCEIVLFGDSSALHGLDPATVTAVTGLSACNIAEPIWIEAVVGTEFPLDAYLRHNQRPRFLVMTFSPTFFSPYRPPFTQCYPQGVLYALRYQHSRELYLRLLKHPVWLLKFSVWTGQTLINMLFNGGPPKLSKEAAEFNPELHRGYLPFPHAPEDHCTRQDFLHTPASDVVRYEQGVADMRRRYAVGGTQVFIDITPAADCDILQDAYRTTSAGLHDNAFQTLPIGDFADGDVHLGNTGVQLYSRQVGEQILAAMHTPAGPRP